MALFCAVPFVNYVMDFELGRECFVPGHLAASSPILLRWCSRARHLFTLINIHSPELEGAVWPTLKAPEPSLLSVPTAPKKTGIVNQYIALVGNLLPSADCGSRKQSGSPPQHTAVTAVCLCGLDD